MNELTRSFGTEAGFEGREQLLIRLKAGEESAFAEAFELYRDMVYTVACRLLSDKGEALDVTQEVFVTLFRKIRSFRGESSLKTWLYRVAINQAANRNRWWKRHLQSRTLSLDIGREAPEPALESELKSSSPSPARRCSVSEIRSAVQKALQKLPFEQKVAVVLRDVEGLTYEEISEISGESLGTVKSRIARAREKLREELKRYRGSEAL